MSSRLQTMLVPFYVLLCILLGGSSLQLWQSGVLQLLGILLIGAVLTFPRTERAGSGARILIGLAIAALVLVVLQLLPLPPGLWTSLPGRDPLTLGFSTLG